MASNQIQHNRLENDIFRGSVNDGYFVPFMRYNSLMAICCFDYCLNDALPLMLFAYAYNLHTNKPTN